MSRGDYGWLEPPCEKGSTPFQPSLLSPNNPVELTGKTPGFLPAAHRERSAAFLAQKVVSKRYASYTLICREDDMSSLSVDEGKLKDLLKAAIIEVLEERKDLVRDLLEEALEDIVLVRAIEAGEQTGTVSRDEVFKVLEGGQ
jgi:hypothetical protein